LFHGWRMSEDDRLLHGPVYIYSVGHEICAVRAVDAQRPPVADSSKLCFFGGLAVGVGGGLVRYEFPALDFNYRRGEVYFSETSFRVQTIRRAHLVNKRNNSAVVHGVGVVKGLLSSSTVSKLSISDERISLARLIKLIDRFLNLFIYPLIDKYVKCSFLYQLLCMNSRRSVCQENIKQLQFPFPLCLQQNNWRRPLRCACIMWQTSIRQNLKSKNLSLKELIDTGQNYHPL